jgi:hypothetical protein
MRQIVGYVYVYSQKIRFFQQNKTQFFSLISIKHALNTFIQQKASGGKAREWKTGETKIMKILMRSLDAWIIFYIIKAASGLSQ